MKAKTYLIICSSSFSLMVLGAVIGKVLEANGIAGREMIGPEGADAITIAYLLLFCMMAFAIVPLAVRLFIVLQLKIGNGEAAPAKWFQAHEQAVVFGFWSMMIIGVSIICVLERDDILNSLR